MAKLDKGGSEPRPLERISVQVGTSALEVRAEVGTQATGSRSPQVDLPGPRARGPREISELI